MKHYTHLLLFFTLFLFSCNERKSNNFVNTWYDTQHIDPGEAILKINNDNTFSYISNGPQIKSFSNGSYKIVGDSLILMSKKDSGCYFIVEFGECVFPELKQTKNDCQPPKTVIYEYFDNDVFYIQNDSLIHKSNETDSCPSTSQNKFARTKKDPRFVK